MLQKVRDVIIDDNCMWIITDNLNSLLKYDFTSGELELEAVFPEMMRSDNGAFSKILKLGDEIYFIPRVANGIIYYNLLEKRFYELKIPFDGFQEEKNMNAVVYGKYIYCINRFPDMVIKIDSVTKETNIYFADVDTKTDRSVENKIYCTYRFICLHHGKIIWPNYYNVLTMFDIENERFSTDVLTDFPCEKMENSQNLYGMELNDWIAGVKSFDDMLWLCSHKDKWYLYQDGLQRVDNTLFSKCLDSYYAADIKDGPYIIFLDIVTLGDELWFIPAYQNKCIIYDKKTKQFVEALDDYVKNWRVVRREYSTYKPWGSHKILLYSYFENCFYVIDKESNSVSRKEIKFPYGKFIKENAYFEQLFIKGNMYCFDDLEYLLNEVKRSSEKEKKDLLGNRNIGKAIFEIIAT